MKYCSKCGKELADEAIVCPNCGFIFESRITQSSTTTVTSKDTLNPLLFILAILIPLFGIIYWVVKRTEAPQAAKTYGIVSICAWVFYFLIALGI